MIYKGTVRFYNVCKNENMYQFLNFLIKFI